MFLIKENDEKRRNNAKALTMTINLKLLLPGHVSGLQSIRLCLRPANLLLPRFRLLFLETWIPSGVFGEWYMYDFER